MENAAPAESVLSHWREYFPQLVARFGQGFNNSPGNRAQKVGCSDAWLRRTDYTKAQSCTKSSGSRLRNLPNTSGGMLYAV